MSFWPADHREEEEDDSDAEQERYEMELKRKKDAALLAQYDLQPGDLMLGVWHLDQDVVHEIWGGVDLELAKANGELLPEDFERIAYGHTWTFDNIKAIDIKIWEKVNKNVKFLQTTFFPEQKGLSFRGKRDMMLELFDHNEEALKESKIREKLAVMLMAGQIVERFNDIMMYKTTLKDIMIGFDHEKVGKKGPKALEEFFRQYKRFN